MWGIHARVMLRSPARANGLVAELSLAGGACELVQVKINYAAPTLGPEDVEKRITFPIETGISGLAGIESTRSFSRNGYGLVTAIFRVTGHSRGLRDH